MPAGYDSRTQYTDRYEGQRWDPSGLLVKSVHGQKKKSTITSFRSNVKGTPLNPKSVDLYHGFLKRDAGLADYLNPGPRLLAELEASGLAADGDYQNQAGFQDTGHPFTLERRAYEYSALGPTWFRNPAQQPSDPQGRARGFSVNKLVFESGAVSRLLWPLASGPSSGTRRWWSDPSIYSIPSPDYTKIESDGTKLLTLAAPGRADVDVLASVGELYAGMPGVPGAALLRGGLLPAVGSEYLNLVFGLIPTYDDAIDIAKVMKTLSIRLLQLKRDAGRPVRRNLGLPLTQKAEIFEATTDLRLGGTNISVDCLENSGFGYNQVTDYGSGTGTLGSVRTAEAIPTFFMRETRKVWFSGSFTYQIPTIPGLSGKLETWLSEYDRLLGLSANSVNAWQLTPWSWLIDWFLDIRQNLDAISVAHDDNLVVNYGYCMERIERTEIAKVQFTGGTGIAGNPFVHTESSLISKRRIRANPYGFVKEADSSQWSSYRLAVLGALGISRL